MNTAQDVSSVTDSGGEELFVSLALCENQQRKPKPMKC